MYSLYMLEVRLKERLNSVEYKARKRIEKWKIT